MGEPNATHAALDRVRDLMDAETMARTLRRMALEIIEREQGTTGLVLVGIRTGGVPLADRLAVFIRQIEGATIPVGAVDITLYRDDVLRGLPRPVIGSTELPFQLDAKKVILVDDVLYTGRTVRAALDALNDYGRPKRVRLAVLVDRGRRELPVQGDYVGIRVESEATESVQVHLHADAPQRDCVTLYRLAVEPAP